MLAAAIKLQPRFPAAYARLGTLLRGKLPEDDLRTIEGLLADADLGRHPRAAPLRRRPRPRRPRRVRPGRDLRRRPTPSRWSSGAEGVVDRPEDHERFVDRIIGAFDRDFFGRTAGLGLRTHRPIFVVGLPRSGTTLVEQILASHPRVHGAGERLFGRRAFESLPGVLGRAGLPIECVASVDESLKRLAGEHLGKLNAMDLGRYDRIVDKLPDNYMYLGLLVAMFPDAVFIHCRRTSATWPYRAG